MYPFWDVSSTLSFHKNNDAFNRCPQTARNFCHAILRQLADLSLVKKRTAYASSNHIRPVNQPGLCGQFREVSAHSDERVEILEVLDKHSTCDHQMTESTISY